MSKITTHILDISRGRPAAGVEITLYRDTQVIARGHTNSDGRIVDWPETTGAGIYMLRFETKAWFDKQAITSFYPYIEIRFEVSADTHYHIPLLLSPWGYSTYRGT
jgi:5-hydroxyisourate hydrolase